MIITYTWRGTGLLVLVIVPIVIVIEIVCSVNLVSKEFTKAHFRELVISGIAASGVICYSLGRWLNREKVVREVGGRREEIGSVVGSSHQMWGIAVQHWCWIYFALALIVTFLW